VREMGEPIGHPAAVGARILYEAVAPEAKVVLSGVGADELFAGRAEHARFRVVDRYLRLAGPLRWLIEPVVRRLPGFGRTPLAGPVRNLRRLVRSAALTPEEAFLANASSLDDGEKMLLYTPELRDRLDDADPFTIHREHLAEVREADFINRMLYLDLKTGLVARDLALHRAAGAGAGVEARTPFLDRDLATFAFQEIPPDRKVTDHFRPRTKQVLREMIGGHGSGRGQARRPEGFAAPLDRWLEVDLADLVADLLGDEAVRRRGIFNPGSVQALVREHRERRRDWSGQIWQLLVLELWQREFVDSPGPMI
jgi:asparagine synthase (glutamine-hydrolysing)